MEETTGAPGSLAVCRPRRLRASSRDGGGVVNRPPSLLQYAAFETYKAAGLHRGVAAAGAGLCSAHAQQPERVRHVGVLLAAAAVDAEYQSRVGAFLQALALSGWSIGGNLRVDTRWATPMPPNSPPRGGIGRARAGRHPGARCRARGGVAAGHPHRADRVPGPRRSGRRRFCRQPGAAGRQRHRFHEYRIQHGREVAGTAQGDRARRDAGGGPAGYRRVLAPASLRSFKPWRRRSGWRSTRSTCATLAKSNAPSRRSPRSGSGGLIVTAGAAASLHRDLIVTLAMRHKLPAVYFERAFVAAGGLISYGPDYLDQYRKAAGYVDRILRGEKPADLPVQAPTKYLRCSTSRPPRRSASRCSRRCSRAPTRCSNNVIE